MDSQSQPQIESIGIKMCVLTKKPGWVIESVWIYKPGRTQRLRASCESIWGKTIVWTQQGQERLSLNGEGRIKGLIQR